jgi:hypothetical protein
MLGLLRKAPAAYARIQRIEQGSQPAAARLTSGHLPQDFAHFQGSLLDRPEDLGIADAWIASLVELERERGEARGASGRGRRRDRRPRARRN